MSSLNETKYWRSLEERAGDPEFERWLHAEFPNALDERSGEIGRRDFLRLMGASAALAGFGACTKQPLEKIVPYVKQPEEMVPGKPLHFATATTFGGYAQGIIVRSNEGRPTKIEGNPDHPASFGATSIWGQADLLDLYDPDRAQNVLRQGQVSTWNDFLGELARLLQDQSRSGGAGLRVLMQTVTSPTLTRQIGSLLKKFPQTRLHQWDPLAGTRAASEDLIYNFADAAVIVALDSDFLYAHPAALRHARDFAPARRASSAEDAPMSRLYAAEPTPTVTGSNADHRLPVSARDIATLADALLEQITGTSTGIELPAALEKWAVAAAADLQENRGASVVIAGETQPQAVHEIVARINDELGNVGTTISPRPAVAHQSSSAADQATARQAMPTESSSLRSLVEDIRSGGVSLLLILGGNPLYDAPIDLDFGDAISKIPTVVHHSVCANETSKRATWHLPAAHFLESWSDALAFDGSATIIQPLIEPLYDGWTGHQVVEAFIQQPVRSAYEIIHSSWVENPDSQTKWNEAVQRGVAPEPRGGPAPEELPPSEEKGTAPQSVAPPTQCGAFEISRVTERYA